MLGVGVESFFILLVVLVSDWLLDNSVSSFTGCKLEGGTSMFLKGDTSLRLIMVGEPKLLLGDGDFFEDFLAIFNITNYLRKLQNCIHKLIPLTTNTPIVLAVPCLLDATHLYDISSLIKEHFITNSTMPVSKL